MGKESTEFPTMTPESSPATTSKPRRKSTGTVDTKTGKPVVKSRYRGNHVPSTHDFCKFGKCSTHEKAEVEVGTSSSTRRRSTGTFTRQIPKITKPESSVAVKRTPLTTSKSSCDSSVTSEPSSSQQHSEIARSGDGLRIKPEDKVQKKQETVSSVSGKSAEIMVSKNGEGKSSKDRNKGKEKIEGVKENALIVAESSKNQNLEDDQPSSGHQSLPSSTCESADPLLDSKTSSTSSGLIITDSPDIVANPKPAKRIKPKKTGIKITPDAKRLSFKKGKGLETKRSDDSTSTWLKFRKSIGLEVKIESKEKRKSLKSIEIDVAKNNSCESKQEMVILNHKNIEEKKKHTLFNHVIEETLSKLSLKKKNKVKVLVDAFENVISLQENKTTTTTTTTSASKVRPLESNK